MLKPVYEGPWYRLLCFYRREINISFMRQTFSTMDRNRLLSHSINLIHVILTLSLPNTQADSFIVAFCAAIATRCPGG